MPRPPPETESVSPEAAVVRVSPEKVATPPEAVAVNVPPRVAPPGLLARATVTVPLNEESRLPEPFSASTVRPKELPAVTLAGGCAVTTSCDVVRVATPTELVPSSRNKRLPSGPVVIEYGDEPVNGTEYSAIVTVVGLI